MHNLTNYIRQLFDVNNIKQLLDLNNTQQLLGMNNICQLINMNTGVYIIALLLLFAPLISDTQSSREYLVSF
jgi:hypothetical protein